MENKITKNNNRKHSVAKILSNPAIVALLTMIITLLVVGAVYYAKHHKSPISQLNQVIAEVSKDIYLPTGETPALAVVTNPSQLQGSLSSVAKKGDDVLVYEKNSEVIVYRPSTGKIVTVEPVILGSQPNPDITVSIAVLNGSGNVNTMQSFISSLYRQYPNLNLVYKDTAPRLFPTTIVFGATVGDSLAEQIGKSLNIQAGQAPLGISNNLATLTFIIGQDYK